MPFAKLKAELLAARDLRDAALRNALRGNRCTLLQLSLNLPGPDKQPSGSGALFRWAEERLRAEIPSLRKLTESCDGLGPWALYAVQSPANDVKHQTVLIEDSRPGGRLLDIDVYNQLGQACERVRLGLQQRRCLICNESARDCIRLQSHSAAQLKATIDELLAPYRT